MWITGTQAKSEAYALLCTLALDCQSVSTLLWYFMLLSNVSSNLYTQVLEKNFPVCNKRQFEFLKLNLLVYSAGNTRAKGEADVLLTEPFFFPATIDLYPKASSLLGSAFLPLGCLL